MDNFGSHLIFRLVFLFIFIAWNFKSGERLHTLQSKQAICALRVRWPLVVTCTTEFELSDERCKGVKLFDMEKEILIRHIECGYASDVHLKGTVTILHI